jgi:hypothetical protein
MKRQLISYLFFTAGVIGIVHCGGDDETGTATGGASGTGTGGASGTGTGGAAGSGTGGAAGSGTGGTGGATLTDAGNNDPDCPTTEPDTGTSCADAGVGGPGGGACRYTNGSTCFCGGGGGNRNWFCFSPDGGGTFDGGAFCPMTQPADGTFCGQTVGRTCTYSNATCTCEPREAGPGNGWSCQ